MTSNEFIEILADKLSWESDAISETSEISDVGQWDSMAILGFIAIADKSLGVNPPPESVVAAKTIEDLLAIVAEGLSDR